jgi:hypothetical protein
MKKNAYLKKKIHASYSVLLVKTIIAEAINAYQRRAS